MTLLLFYAVPVHIFSSMPVCAAVRVRLENGFLRVARSVASSVYIN